jgi:hypothetical protein
MGQVSLNPGLQPKRRIDAPAHQVHLPHAACFHTEQLCKPAPIVRGAGIATLYRSAKRRLAFELCWQPGGSAAQASEAAAARATAEELQRCREALAELAGPALPSTPRDCGAPPALALLNTSARPLPHTALCHSCLRDSGALRALQDRRPRPRPILPNYFPIAPQRALAPPGAALYARAVLADAGEGGGAEAPPRPLTPRERSLLETCAPDMRPPQQFVRQGWVRVLIPARSAKTAVEQQSLGRRQRAEGGVCALGPCHDPPMWLNSIRHLQHEWQCGRLQSVCVCRHAAQRHAAMEVRRMELAAAAGGSPGAPPSGDWCEVLQLEVGAVVHRVRTLWE